jgi:membrane protein YdbS with pleckstrin-like domain
MPPLNTRHRQPLSALFYTSLGAFLAAIFMVYLGVVLVSSQVLDGALPQSLSASLLIAIVVVALSTIAYPALHYSLLTYEVHENALTVYSGVVFRQHETINFSRIQSVENERGPILALFGLTLMEVWTARPTSMRPLRPRGRAPT